MASETHKQLHAMNIQTATENLTLNVLAGIPIFVLGRNGTGKSALVNRLSAQSSGKVVYMPGSRPCYFDNESLSMTPASRRGLSESMKHYDSTPDTRWKSEIGTSRNEKAIHDLLNAETQYKLDAANQIRSEGKNSPAVARLQSEQSPLDIVNSILAQANLTVKLEVYDSELKVVQGCSKYSYARMSDGERSALVFAAEVVAAQPGMIFLIDEPELHLHPSIVVSLVKALILARPDCGFIICTHQIELPTVISKGWLVLVRGSTWDGDIVSAWDVDIIQSLGEIPEWLWVDLIGSRRKILFVEGTSSSSLDQPLYSLLFPEISVRPRESCTDVVKAVEGLRAVEEVHRAKAFGLIDGDGMSEEQVSKLENRGVYALPMFSVESLVYSEEAQAAVASQQAETLGITTQELLKAAKEAAISSLKLQGKQEHLAGRLAERQMRDELFSKLPSRRHLIEQKSSDLSLQIQSPYPAELSRITDLVNSSSLFEIISKYPVRETGVLANIAKALRFNSRDDYERAVLRRISADSALLSQLKQRLGKLATLLE